MKNKVLIVTIVIAVCLIVTSCGKEKKEEKIKVGGWETVLTKEEVGLDESLLQTFNNAKENYTSLILDPVALLGKQVVAGTNYMFLAKGYQKGEEDKATYKIVIIYKNLEGMSTITRVKDFDFTKYTNENIENNTEKLVGGWFVESSGKLNVLDGKVGEIWEKATETLTGMSYNPIAVVGKQLVSGTNYAVLCYGRGSYDETTEGIYLVTLYEDLKGTSEIVSNAYINLAEFNK